MKTEQLLEDLEQQTGEVVFIFETLQEDCEKKHILDTLNDIKRISDRLIDVVNKK